MKRFLSTLVAPVVVIGGALASTLIVGVLTGPGPELVGVIA